MTFLDLPALAIATGAVPLLLLLYFLRLRRRRLRMPSTMLWHRATEDIQANVPFQRLRFSPLLLLQLLALAAIVMALGRPVLRAAPGGALRLILVIDRSASMSAAGTGGATRLDAARAAARALIERLGRRSEPTAMMVVSFAATPQVVCGFESDRRTLLDAIDAIAPTDEEADLDAALQLAGAFAGRQETTEAAPEVVLISDGGVRPPADPGGFSLRAGRFRFVRAAADAACENLGIASLAARRDHREPAKVLVLARLVNASAAALETAVTLRIDGEPAQTRMVSVPPAAQHLGEAAFSAALDLPGGALVTLACGRQDELAADDTAALVVEPQAAPRIGLVHAGPAPDPYLVALLEATAPQRLTTLAAGPEPMPPPWPKDAVDVLVFDRVTPTAAPESPALTVGAAPFGATRPGTAESGAGRVLSWDRIHPLLRHVSLDALVYGGPASLDLPAPWIPLAHGPQGPVLAVSAGPPRQIAIGFALAQSNWPMDVSVAVFLQNALDYLFPSAAEETRSFRPGDTIVVKTLPGTRRLSIEGPAPAQLETEPESEVTLPALRRVGLYHVRGAAAPMDRIAVNLASDVESDLRPRETLVVNSAAARAEAAGETAPIELWPVLAVVAAGLLLLEWVVYCLRVRG